MSKQPSAKPLRIFYAAGPGNAIGTYSYWKKGQDDPTQVALTYSGQFYDVCTALNAQGYLMAASSQPGYLQDQNFIIEHRPIPLRTASGIMYHLGRLWYGLRLIASAVHFRADVAIVVEGSAHFFLLSLLPWLGIKIIPLLQCTLWRKFYPRSKVENFQLLLARRLFAQDSTAIIVVANGIAEQVAEITDGQSRPIFRVFPVYRKEQFADIKAPNQTRNPFRVLFAGRIERDKGVFELLEIARRFKNEGRFNILFDVCGSGSMLERLRFEVGHADLALSFFCHDHCNKVKMREMFSQSHVVIVPTNTDFVEGFNKVVVEGILSGRPVITSSVCNDLELLKNAIVEVPPNNTQAYGDAILELQNNYNFYETKRIGCVELQELFYDVSRGWGAALKAILLSIQW